MCILSLRSCPFLCSHSPSATRLFIHGILRANAGWFRSMPLPRGSSDPEGLNLHLLLQALKEAIYIYTPYARAPLYKSIQNIAAHFLCSVWLLRCAQDARSYGHSFIMLFLKITMQLFSQNLTLCLWKTYDCLCIYAGISLSLALLWPSWTMATDSSCQNFKQNTN